MDATKRTDEWPFGYGKCHCGCGRETSISPKTNRPRGLTAGVPVRFVPHHNRRLARLGDWPVVVEDLGYATPCHVWKGGNSGDGYGCTYDDGRRIMAHRLAWKRKHGEPPRHMQLDHLCRNRACVNPDHLELVTTAENTRRSSTAKITKAEASAIRDDPRPQAVIAAEYGITQQHVSKIKLGTRWVADMGGGDVRPRRRKVDSRSAA